MKLRKIMEEFVDIVPFKSFFRQDEKQINVFKAPFSTKEIIECSSNGAIRGVMFFNGDLYIADGDLIHLEILKVLSKIEIADKNDFQKWNTQPAYFEKFLSVVSFKDSNYKTWKPAESYDEGGRFMSEKFLKYYEKYKNLFKSKGFSLSGGFLAREFKERVL